MKPARSQTASTEADSAQTPAIRQAAAILRCGVSEVDPLRSFQDQGGDSLMCVDLLMALEADYGRPVDFDWAMQLPLARLHELLTQDAAAPEMPTDARPGIFLTGGNQMRLSAMIGGTALSKPTVYGCFGW